MKIVIEMNDEQYYEVCRGDSSAALVPKDDLINVIRNSKPLPKGHGRLIDADERSSEIDEEDRWVVDQAPTIIEADGGEEG